jgi:sulfatase maturation enzyme AslB (radical SAM superfamily)
MIEHRRFDLCFSFVTNGTVYKPQLVEKLKKFRRVGFEISIETLDQKNNYVRQGTDTAQVLKNITSYLTHCNNSSITVALRPAPSLLTVGSYISLLEFSLKNKLIVKSNLCIHPRFMKIDLLPQNVKEKYKIQYINFLEQLTDDEAAGDYNASDPHNYKLAIKEQAQMCLSLLNSSSPLDSDQQLTALTAHCRQWDNVYKLDARKIYPELAEIWDRYGY